MTFSRFMAMVDDEIMDLTGILDHTDLSDYDYYNAWKDEREPAEVARAVLENDDTYSSRLGR